MKKIKKLLLVLTILAVFPLGVFAKEKVNLYLFKREGCMYCAGALSFFESLGEDAEYQNYFNLVVKDVSNIENSNLMNKTAKKLGVTLSGVPFIVIGEQHFEGYTESYNDSLKEAIKNAYEHESRDIVAEGNKDTSAATILILVAIVGGIAFLIYMAKDHSTQDEEKETEEKSSQKATEPKKATTTKKKSTTKKSTKTKTTNKK